MAILALIAAGATAQRPPSVDLDAMAKLIADGRLETAESELREIVDLEESAAARDLLGLVLAKQGRTAEAEGEFRRAIELAPEFAPAHQNLGRLLLQQERHDEALQALREAARAGPLERELAFRLAALEISRGEVEAGERLYESIGLELESVRAMLELARSLARRGEEQRALGVLRHALDLAPNSEEVMSAYARLCLQTTAPVPAMRTLDALTRIHPSVAEYWYLLGIARFQLASTEGALEALGHSLELEPRQPLPLIALGLAFKSLKRFSEAREILVQSLQLMPGNVDALVALAEAEEGLGELELAEEHVLRTLELAEEAPDALYVLGKIRMTQGRHEEARDILLRAVARDPKSDKAHYQLSLAYARLRDRESSQRHLELYRQAREDREELLMEMRTEAGLGVGGMGRGGG